MNTPKTFLIVLIIVFTTAGCIFLEPQPQPTLTPEGEPGTQGDNRLVAVLSVPERASLCTPVDLEFRVTNPSDQAVYLLNWYTPLEGIYGNVFRVSFEGSELPYLGPEVMREVPLAEQYILLEPGGSATAVVDLSTAYDFSNPGHYSIAFKSPQISHAVDDPSEFATVVDALGPVQILSQPVEVEIVPSENGAGDCASNASAPPAAYGENNKPDFPLRTLTGIVKDVSPSARIIWLQTEVDGCTTIALTADTTISKVGGELLEIAQIQQGLTVRASGQPGKNQALIAHLVQVVPPEENQP